ncbi:MAG: arginine--tRNA ligase [Bacteroidales bacterium]|nr:arginine--tRNA ligase [Bacteroidales bacterium]MCF8404317.1 arginine--tRNA ligase [Bacteroidales bacterium]
MLQLKIQAKTIEALKILYGQVVEVGFIQIEKTNRDFSGDFTLVVFPLLKFSKKNPSETADEIGNYLIQSMDEIENFNVIKGFLNLEVSGAYWLNFFQSILKDDKFGFTPYKSGKPLVVEYSSPNTNKPLHLGHVRNNLLGFSISQILKAAGNKVIKVNLVNDRGIHICKSMLAWMKWGDGETPESSGIKSDHLVGKYYVLFDKKHKDQIQELVHRGFTDKDAFTEAPLMKEAQKLLQKWEKADEDILLVWRTMNQWAYEGFDATYKRLGVDFDEINYESKIYLEGKEIVLEGLTKEIFFAKSDNSVWIDLTDEGLDEKLLLRKDGTSVYMTQDIGTAIRRFDAHNPQKLVYVVGNEQIYHFEVLKKIIQKLNLPWYDIIHHLSYGMVELPDGRMKSREGTVVDADDLMDEMFKTAKKTTEDLGKTADFPDEELTSLYNIIGLGALKYYMLKVDPKKNMLFNPEESIDFNGNTGPFIQYTYARIQSIFRKAGNTPEEYLTQVDYSKVSINEEEYGIIRLFYEWPETIKLAAENYSPAVIANYCFELVKAFNHYYQDTPILKRVEPEISNFRILLSWQTGKIIKSAMSLLGIEVPDKM